MPNRGAADEIENRGRPDYRRAGGFKDAWRETAQWAAGQLEARFGDAVRVEYYDLFDPGCPTLPAGAQLPLVLINSEVLSSGEKISIPRIRKRLQELGLEMEPKRFIANS